MNKMTTERLIATVWENPIIYDRNDENFMNWKKRNKTWRSIGKEMGIPADKIRNKWKNLRDTYIKSLRYIQSNESGKPPKKWQWAQKMEIFATYLSVEKNDVLDESSVNFEHSILEESEIHSDSIDSLNVKIEPQEPNHKRSFSNTEEDSVIEIVENYLNKKRRIDDVDATELLFMGYAKTLKSFSPRRQAITKMKIAEIFMNEELDHDKECRNSPISD